MSEPVEKSYTFYQGEKFGPVTFAFGAAVSGGVVDVDDAIVRVSISGNTRDSTVANGEIVVDNVADTVEWTMLEDDTAELSVGTYRGEVIVIDGAGEDQIPVKLILSIKQRLGAPV